jgi:hypothetical protein
MIFFYHTTNVADEILRNKFQDTTKIIDGTSFAGVWLAEKPVGAKGDQILMIGFSGLGVIDFGNYEVVEEGKPYREWCIPAVEINKVAQIYLMSDSLAETMRNPPWEAPNPAASPCADQFRSC